MNDAVNDAVDAAADDTTDLSGLRARIDTLDAQLIEVLAQRFAVGDEVGRYKAAHGLAPRDPDREAAMTQRYRAEAQARGLDPDVAERVFRLIIDTTVQRHQAIPRDETPPTDLDQSR